MQRVPRQVLQCAILLGAPLPAREQRLVPDFRPLPQSRCLCGVLQRPLCDATSPVVFAVDSGALYDPMVKMLQEAGLPVYRKIDRASRALSAFCRDWE